MDLTISRKEWIRGDESISSQLLRKSDNKRCCVGIYARALGVPDEKLAGEAWPNKQLAYSKWDAKEAPWLLTPTDVANINDDEDLDDTNREAQLTELFAEHDVRVTFVD